MPSKKFQPTEDVPLPPIYTMDVETDPFEHGQMIWPFVIGFFDGIDFVYFWGKDCLPKMRAYVEGLPAGIIYMHNGGRFDIFYMMDWLSKRMMIINGRIVKAHMDTGSGIHEIRDSYAIMPFSLKTSGKKDEIDYNKMKVAVRDKHRTEILSYLKQDCKGLWDLCTAFVNRFGPQLTIGSTAMKELKKIHDFQSLNDRDDLEIRSEYYYGGRVQCFRQGIIEQPVKVYDVNSMYPHSMRHYLHPIAPHVSVTKKITRQTCFVTVEGRNYGAFPKREKTGGLRFDVESGTFGVSIHEYRTAVSLGLFVPTKIVKAYNYDDRITFEDFVNYFYESRKQAKIKGDDVYAMFYKFVLNSAYGKFAQNPENYMDYKITPDSEDCRADGWEIFQVDDNFQHIIWQRPSRTFMRHNVATAASITGAARAILLEAIAKSTNPLYCDTDSLICEELEGVEIDENKLGAWKLEKTGDTIAIAGKKLYAVFENGVCVKQANKGVRITADEILDICRGSIVEYKNMAPTLKWDGTHKFIRRKVRMT